MNPNTGRRIFAASLLTGLLVAGHGCSRSETTLEIDEARELYTLSHVPPQFDVAREFLEAQIAPHLANWSPEQFEAATRVIRERLAAENVSRKMLDRLQAQSAPRFTNEVLDWLRTPEARQVHAAAAATTNAEAAAELNDFMAGVKQPKPSQERLALIERYDRAARCSGYSLDSLRLAIYGAGVMTEAVEPNDTRSGDADAMKHAAEQKSELLEPAFEELSAFILRFAFRGLSDADMAAFVERSESEPLQWYYQTLSTLFRDTLEEISSDFGNAFTTALEAQPDA